MLTSATVILCGSVFLLLATNTGVRLGFLLALTGLFGWMTIMGITWSMYGIGVQGAGPDVEGARRQRGQHLRTRRSPRPETLPEPNELPEPPTWWRRAKRCRRSSRPAARSPTLGDLVTTDPDLADRAQGARPAGWLLLPSSDKANGETAAAVATELGPDKRNMFAAADRLRRRQHLHDRWQDRAARTSPQIGRVRHKLRTALHAEEPAGLRRRPVAEGHPPGGEARAGAAGPDRPTRMPR